MTAARVLTSSTARLRSVLVALCVWACGVAAPAAHAAAPLKPAIVMPLAGVAIADDIKLDTEDALRRLLPQFGWKALPRKDTTALLSTIARAGVKCQLASTDCVVRVGALAAVDLVVAGTLSRTASGHALDLVVVDVAALQVRSRATVALDTSSDDAFATAILSATTAVLRPEAWRGQLRMQVREAGASIYVDGLLRGFSPLPQAVFVTPGPHDVHVVLPAFQTEHRRIDIPFLGKAELEIPLRPGTSTPPPGVAVVARPLESAVAPAAEGDDRKVLRVAVYEPTVVDVPPRVARLLAGYLASEIRKRERVSVLGGEELRGVLRASGQADANGVCNEERCLADIADALGVDVVVVTQFAGSGAQLLFGARRIDQRAQEVTATFERKVDADDGPALLGLVGASVAQLFADLPLRAGAHVGVDDTAIQLLVPPPVPAVVPVSLWGASAVGGAVAAGLASAWWQQAARYDDDRATVARGGSVVFADLVAQRDAVEATANAAWGVAGVSAALALVGAIVVPWTDWQAADDDGGAP